METHTEPALAPTLEAARNHIYEAFELLAERTDVPDEVIYSIQDAHRAVRLLEADIR